MECKQITLDANLFSMMESEQPTKKRKFPWDKAYSKISRLGIEEGLCMDSLLLGVVGGC